MRVGDTLFICELDRLGPSFQGSILLAADRSARKVDCLSLTDGFDTSTPFSVDQTSLLGNRAPRVAHGSSIVGGAHVSVLQEDASEDLV